MILPCATVILIDELFFTELGSVSPPCKIVMKLGEAAKKNLAPNNQAIERRTFF